jgi:hypothetical protein
MSYRLQELPVFGSNPTPSRLGLCLDHRMNEADDEDTVPYHIGVHAMPQSRLDNYGQPTANGSFDRALLGTRPVNPS